MKRNINDHSAQKGFSKNDIAISSNADNNASNSELHNYSFCSWNQQEVFSETLVKKRVLRKIEPSSASLDGGIWERVVRSFIHVFYAVLGNRPQTDEIFTTAFCVVQQIANARPLVPASSEATDLDTLTSNHFWPGISGSV